MADRIPILDANATARQVLTDEVTDATFGQGHKQIFGLMDATPDSTNKLVVDSSGRAAVLATIADGSDSATGATTDAEAAGNGSVVAILKKLRTLLSGGLPAALGGSGGLKTEVVSALPTGGNTIGTVNVGTMPAAARTTDAIAAALQTDAIMNGLTALTPKFAKIVASGSGATTIVSAVSSKKIRVLSWDLLCNAAVNAKWQSHVTPTDISGLYYNGTNGGEVIGFCPVGRFETVAGEALDINLSGAVAVGGSLVYVEV